MELAMDAAELKQWLASVVRLTPAQKEMLLRTLSVRDDEAEVERLVESRIAQVPACPRCAGTRIVRNGSASGLQRYKCRACQRTFNALTKTPLARLRMKDKWLQQQDVLSRGLIIRLAAVELDVAPSTAFRWRHRFLELAQPVKAAGLTGVVEADETFFRRSSKGQRPGRAPRKRGGRVSRMNRGEELIPVLVARDRSGATADFLLEAVSKDCLSEVLGPRVNADAILCTDGSAAMAATAKQLGVHHEAMNLSAGERVRGPWHIQNANAYHGRLKGWMKRFRGVATSYLESYLGWFRALDRASRSRQLTAPMLKLALGLDRGGHH
jgi:transposase-like protein